MKVELTIDKIINGKTVRFAPLVEEGIQLESERQGGPATLKFNVVKDEVINFTEGDQVSLRVDGKDLFSGFVFIKFRNKDNIINVTAFDQIRYLKNKDTYCFENKTAGGVVKEIAKDYGLKVGDIENTGFVIPSLVKENTTLIDCILEAIALTYEEKKEMYVLYDDFGKLTFKNIGNLKVDFVVSANVAENYSYKTDIDSNTYNKIVLYNKNETDPNKKVIRAGSEENVKKWGKLQYFESIDNSENAQAKAKALLELYNRKTKSLSVSNVLGDTRVRAGCMVKVYLNVGDTLISHYLIVEKCNHTFKENEHLMDLTLVGGF